MKKKGLIIQIDGFDSVACIKLSQLFMWLSLHQSVEFSMYEDKDRDATCIKLKAVQKPNHYPYSPGMADCSRKTQEYAELPMSEIAEGGKYPRVNIKDLNIHNMRV